MNISSVIVISISIIILLCVVMFLVEIFIPLNIKFEFNRICREYLFILDKNNDLTFNEKKELKEKIGKLGLNDVLIKIESSGNKFGDEITFEVKGYMLKKSIKTLFFREEERIDMSYERKLTIKRITN